MRPVNAYEDSKGCIHKTKQDCVEQELFYILGDATQRSTLKLIVDNSRKVIRLLEQLEQADHQPIVPNYSGPDRAAKEEEGGLRS